MAQSVIARIKRGHLRMVWNTTLNRMEFFRRTSNSRFLFCDPYNKKDIKQGPGHHKKTLDKWQSA